MRRRHLLVHLFINDQEVPGMINYIDSSVASRKGTYKFIARGSECEMLNSIYIILDDVLIF